MIGLSSILITDSMTLYKKRKQKVSGFIQRKSISHSDSMTLNKKRIQKVYWPWCTSIRLFIIDSMTPERKRKQKHSFLMTERTSLNSKIQ